MTEKPSAFSSPQGEFRALLERLRLKRYYDFDKKELVPDEDAQDAADRLEAAARDRKLWADYRSMAMNALRAEQSHAAALKARVEELERERDEALDARSLLSEQGHWKARAEAAEARVAELRRENDNAIDDQCRYLDNREAAEARATALAQENKRLREALVLIETDLRIPDWIRNVARAALEGKAAAPPTGDERFPQPDRNRAGKEPCGECHLQEGETCDICGASAPPAGDERRAIPDDTRHNISTDAVAIDEVDMSKLDLKE